MVKKIRVLIVDDSSFARLAIRGMLFKEADFEVVGTAVDGIDAVEKVATLRPDVVTMDIHMPRMDGISALRQIMLQCPSRVLIVTALDNGGAQNTFDALDAGAVDYIGRTNIAESEEGRESFQEELIRKLRSAAASPIPRQLKTRQSCTPVPPSSPAPRSTGRASATRIKVVGIGASTGGPVAVQEVLTAIPSNFPLPIVVALHMPAQFTSPYAARLAQKCDVVVREARDGDLLLPGTVLLAPGGAHTQIVQQGGRLSVKVSSTFDRPGQIYIPSVDILFESLAAATGGQALGVVLTGMGNDGFKGMAALKQSGGMTMAQDRASCTIYGMPRACIEGGVADSVLPLGKIGLEIARVAQ